MTEFDLELKNLDALFPASFSQEQVARAKTAFLKELALAMHKFYGGKIMTVPKAGLYGFNWFNVWYTPGVSKVSTTIRDNNDATFDLSNRGNLVAVVSDSTRVLGRRRLHAPGRPGRDGRQGLPHEVPGRHRRRRAVHRQPRRERQARPRQDHRVREDAPVQLRRGEPGRHLPAELLQGSRRPARELRDPGLARRRPGHGLRHPGGPHQRTQTRRQGHRQGKDRLPRRRRIEHHRCAASSCRPAATPRTLSSSTPRAACTKVATTSRPISASTGSGRSVRPQTRSGLIPSKRR